jgi:hypothetical protein
MSSNSQLTPFGLGSQLRDYRHGQKPFGNNNNELMPKFGYQYHVYFGINTTSATQFGNGNSSKQTELGMLVKSVDLPKFALQTKDLNAYNQHITVQTGIKYDPINIVFHDDSANLVRDFWQDYMKYYFGDSYNDLTTYIAHKENRYGARQSQRWGYTPRDAARPQYIDYITVYSLHQQHYTEYQLINPTIESWAHPMHQEGANEFIANSMRIKYEGVIYGEGEVGDDYVAGLGGIHYDSRISDLHPPRNPKGFTNFDIDPQLVPYSLVQDKTTGVLRGPIETLASRALDQFGRSVVNTALTAAANRLSNNKITKTLGGRILQTAQNAAVDSLSMRASGEINARFPSIGKSLFATSTPSADTTAQQLGAFPGGEP